MTWHLYRVDIVVFEPNCSVFHAHHNRTVASCSSNVPGCCSKAVIVSLRLPYLARLPVEEDERVRVRICLGSYRIEESYRCYLPVQLAISLRSLR